MSIFKGGTTHKAAEITRRVSPGSIKKRDEYVESVYPKREGGGLHKLKMGQCIPGGGAELSIKKEDLADCSQVNVGKKGIC